MIALIATQLLIVGPQNPQIENQQQAVNALAKAAAWSLQIQGEPDAERVALASTTGDPDVTGTIAYSPGTSRLVVLAQGLEQPPAGMEYRCWMESGGQRTRDWPDVLRGRRRVLGRGSSGHRRAWRGRHVRRESVACRRPQRRLGRSGADGEAG